MSALGLSVYQSFALVRHFLTQLARLLCLMVVRFSASLSNLTFRCFNLLLPSCPILLRWIFCFTVNFNVPTSTFCSPSSVPLYLHLDLLFHFTLRRSSVSFILDFSILSLRLHLLYHSALRCTFAPSFSGCSILLPPARCSGHSSRFSFLLSNFVARYAIQPSIRLFLPTDSDVFSFPWTLHSALLYLRFPYSMHILYPP